jgi:hypothetical protein
VSRTQPSRSRRLDGRLISGVSRSSRECRLAWFFGELARRRVSDVESRALKCLLKEAPKHGTALFAMGCGVAVQPAGRWCSAETRSVQYFVGTVSLAVLARELAGEEASRGQRRGLARCEAFLRANAEESLLELCNRDQQLCGSATAHLARGFQAHEAYYSGERGRALRLPRADISAQSAFGVAAGWGAGKSAALIGALAALGVVFRHRSIPVILDAATALFGSIQILDDLLDLGEDVLKEEPNAIASLARFLVRERWRSQVAAVGLSGAAEQFCAVRPTEDVGIVQDFRGSLQSSLAGYRKLALKSLTDSSLEQRLRVFLTQYGQEVWRAVDVLESDALTLDVRRAVMRLAVTEQVEESVRVSVRLKSSLEPWLFPTLDSPGDGRGKPHSSQNVAALGRRLSRP